MNKENLLEIQDAHEKWCQGLPGGKQAYFTGDLSALDFSIMRFPQAVFYDADLTHSFLHYTNLKRVKFIRCTLRFTSFRYAELEGALFEKSVLEHTKFDSANLNGSYFKNSCKKLDKVSLLGANISGANVQDVDLSTVMVDNKTIGYWPVMPEGDIIAWKWASPCLIKLLVPSDAKRSSATSRKCRVSHAKVLSIYNYRQNEYVEVIHHESSYGPITYVVDEFVYPDGWNENRWAECSKGIHCFLTRGEALKWGLDWS